MSTVAAVRPGLRSWLTLAQCEAKMVVRDTAGLVVPIGLPLLILVMNASAASSEIVENGRSALDVYVLPLVFTIVMASIGIINMPSFLAYYRRSGILRRLAVTPASPAMVLVAQMLVSLVQAVIGIGLAFAIAVLAFDARPPVNAWAAVGVVALAIVAMYAIGMVVAALAPPRTPPSRSVWSASSPSVRWVGCSAAPTPCRTRWPGSASGCRSVPRSRRCPTRGRDRRWTRHIWCRWA